MARDCDERVVFKQEGVCLYRASPIAIESARSVAATVD